MRSLFSCLLLGFHVISQRAPPSKLSLVQLSEDGKELTQSDLYTLASEDTIVSQAGLSGMFVLGGKGIRQGISVPLTSVDLEDQSSIISAFTSAIVFVVILVLMLLVRGTTLTDQTALVFVLVMMLGLICCCCRKKPEKDPVQVSQLRRTSSIASIFLCVLLFFIAIIGGYSASGLVDQGVDFMANGIHSLFVDSLELVDGLDEAVDGTLGSINTTLVISLDEMNVFLQTDVFGSIYPVFSDLTSELSYLDGEMRGIVLLGDNTQAEIIEMQSLATQLQTGSNDISGKIDEINSILADSLGGTHQLKVPFVAPDFSNIIPAALFAVGNISAAVDPLRLNFQTIADDITLQISDAKIQIDDEFRTVAEDFDTKINVDVRPSLTESVVEVQDLVYEAISDNPILISDYIETARGYLFYLSTVRLIYYTFALLILLVSLFSIKQKMRRTLKVASCCAGLLWILALLITIACVLVSLILGSACESYFVDRTDPFSGLTNNSTDIILKAGRTIDSCIAGDSILVASLELSDVGAQFNLTEELDKVSAEIDFDTISSVIDDVDISPDPISDDLDPVLNGDSSTDVQSIANVNELNSTSVAIPPASVSTLISNLVDLVVTRQASVDVSSFDFTPALVVPANGADPRSIFAVEEFITLTNELNQLISMFYTSVSPASIVMQLNEKREIILKNTQSLTSRIADIKLRAVSAEALMTTTLSSVTIFKTTARAKVDAYIPLFIERVVIEGGKKADLVLQAGLPCKKIGQDVRAIEQSVCSVLLLGVDAVWFSYFFISLVGLISLPVFFIAVKRFGPRPKKNHQSQWTLPQVIARNMPSMANLPGMIKKNRSISPVPMKSIPMNESPTETEAIPMNFDGQEAISSSALNIEEVKEVSSSAMIDIEDPKAISSSAINIKDPKVVSTSALNDLEEV